MSVRIMHFDPDATGPAVFLGPTEAQVMEIAWMHSPVSVKRVLFLLDVDEKPAYTTIMTMLSRLTQKGLLFREKEGRYFVYRYTVSRERFLRERVTLVQRTLETNFPSYLR